MSQNIYCNIAVMAIATYLIRFLPLVLLRKEIKQPYIISFLHYVPYTTLALMTFPSILESTASFWSALAGFVVALSMAWRGKSLLYVSTAACVAVFIAEQFII